LKTLHEQGACQVAMDGVQNLSTDKGDVTFPAILITHVIDKPGFESQEQTTIATCYRTCSYLKARALGARIVDARWIVDSENAGMLLDCEKYEVGCDLESYTHLKTLSSEARALLSLQIRESRMMLSHKLDGITFGLLCEMESRGSLKISEESKSQAAESQTSLETKPLTFPQIESLVQMWGGETVARDELIHVDILLVDDCMTLEQIAAGLKEDICGSSKWSIEKWTKEFLDDFFDEDESSLLSIRIPIIRTKWLEDSICLHSLQSLSRYCWGILCLS